MNKIGMLLYAVVILILVWVSDSATQIGKYPVTITARTTDGTPLPEMEEKLRRAVNGLGYNVVEDGLILLEGLVSITGEQRIGGIRPKSMVNLNLDVQIKDAEQQDILKSFSATGKGLGNSGVEAVQKGVQQIQIDTGKLLEALEDCEDDYLRIQERRERISKERFEEGEGLFKEGRYREALAALKRVYPETTYAEEARRLIQKIRQVMPKPVIAVLKFKANADSIAENFRNLLTTTLVQMESEEVIVLERDQIKEILEEQELELQGLVEPATASEYGRLIGANFTLLGRITVSDDEAEIDAKLVKVGTGEIVIAFHTTSLTDELEFVAQDIVAKIHQGIEDGIVIVDSGDDDGCGEITVDSTSAPRVMIVISEQHIHRPIPDPAGETEMIRWFVKSGFRVVDETQVKKVRETREGKAAAKGDIEAARAIARQHGAEVIIVGEAFSENIPRPGQQLQTCSARVEARAIDADTGMILAANGKEAHATDATEGVAAKKALRTAGRLLAANMIEQIVDAWNRRGDSHEIELLVRNIEYTQLIALESFLKKHESITDIQRRNFNEGIALVEIHSKNKAQSLADVLAVAQFDAFTVKIETVTGNTIEISVERK